MTQQNTCVISVHGYFGMTSSACVSFYASLSFSFANKGPVVAKQIRLTPNLCGKRMDGLKMPCFVFFLSFSADDFSDREALMNLCFLVHRNVDTGGAEAHKKKKG